MTNDEKDDDQVPRFDQETIEVIEQMPDLQKQVSGGALIASSLAVVSATLAYHRESGHLSGWITYPFDPVKIRFVSTKFTTRMLSFYGSGGFLNVALPRESLAGKTGTFATSGNRELSLLRLYVGNELVFVPLTILGQGGMGHLAEGEVYFSARQ